MHFRNLNEFPRIYIEKGNRKMGKKILEQYEASFCPKAMACWPGPEEESGWPAHAIGGADAVTASAHARATAWWHAHWRPTGGTRGLRSLL
jgi:hypothetical protein